ncbi:MAG: COG4705 family protein [Planctomycetota bacterium]
MTFAENPTGPVRPSTGRQLWNKVPEITIFFWIIKVLCTTVGETCSDFLSETLKFGDLYTGLIMGAILAIVLVIQFKTRSYKAGVYWLAVVLISIVGTLISDYFADVQHVPLIFTTIFFSGALAVTFIVWYVVENTLSIHTIYTFRREVFYWLAILFTFSLGTAAGDLLAEKFELGYLVSVLIFAGAIALVTALYYGVKLNAVFAFWAAYVMTRPLGGSLGDLLSSPRSEGGLALGTVGTSTVFLTAILAAVIYLIITKKDVATKPYTLAVDTGEEPWTENVSLRWDQAKPND